MASQNKYRGRAIDELLGHAVAAGGRVLLDVEQLRQVDLGTGRSAGSLIVLNYPFNGGMVLFERSGSHWKIGVSYRTGAFTPTDTDRIWNLVLCIASEQIRAKTVNAEGLWTLRLWLPLVRSGVAAMQLIEEAVNPITVAARAVLTELLANPPPF